MNVEDLVESTAVFRREEFPPGRLFSELDPDFFQLVCAYRLKLGRVIHPSRWVSEDGELSGVCRFDGSRYSRHYAVDRKADAIDIFPEGDIFQAWMRALEMPFGGVGIYFDTKKGRYQPGPMLHLDGRNYREIWLRHEGKYHYLSADAEERKKFWSIMADWIKESYL